MPPSFTTVLIGEMTVLVPDVEEAFRFLVTVIRSEEQGTFRILGAETDYPTLEAARAAAEVSAPVVWRASTAPLPEEQGCFLCGHTLGRPMEARERHPKRLCQVCALEATDEHGRVVRFGNVDLRGGFRSVYADTGEEYGRHECFVRGVACMANEARFGGIVIEPRRT
jgi:hypothetical protein